MTIARTDRVVCFSVYTLRSASGWSESIHATIASRSCDGVGWLCGRQIMSPREMSRSSVSSSVTAIDGRASATGPSAVSMRSMRVVSPDGSTITSSPGRSVPAATVPA